MSRIRKRSRPVTESDDSDGSGSRSSSDDDSEEEGGYFGQRLPPLSKAISDILKRYPDGQIFKVSRSLATAISFLLQSY